MGGRCGGSAAVKSGCCGARRSLRPRRAGACPRARAWWRRCATSAALLYEWQIAPEGLARAATAEATLLSEALTAMDARLRALSAAAPWRALKELAASPAAAPAAVRGVCLSHPRAARTAFGVDTGGRCGPATDAVRRRRGRRGPHGALRRSRRGVAAGGALVSRAVAAGPRGASVGGRAAARASPRGAAAGVRCHLGSGLSAAPGDAARWRRLCPRGGSTAARLRPDCRRRADAADADGRCRTGRRLAMAARHGVAGAHGDAARTTGCVAAHRGASASEHRAVAAGAACGAAGVAGRGRCGCRAHHPGAARRGRGHTRDAGAVERAFCRDPRDLRSHRECGAAARQPHTAGAAASR